MLLAGFTTPGPNASVKLANKPVAVPGRDLFNSRVPTPVSRIAISNSSANSRSANRGDRTTARKMHASLVPYTPLEVSWIEEAIRLMIRRVAEIAAGATCAEITMKDLPALQILRSSRGRWRTEGRVHHVTAASHQLVTIPHCPPPAADTAVRSRSMYGTPFVIHSGAGAPFR